MSVEVLTPGLSTTVQDFGRPGYYHLGIPESGVMDIYSFRCANRLVGNDEDAAVLEITLMGPTLAFRDRRRVAVTGADVEAKVDGESQPPWSSFIVAPGQVLSFGRLRGSARAYVAIAGGIDVPLVLGSRSTSKLNVLGGVDGRALQQGDVLDLFDAQSGGDAVIELPEALRPGLTGDVTDLRVVKGMYWHRLLESAGEDFFASPWQVTNEADRVAIRFGGGPTLGFVEREQPFGAGLDPSNVVDCGYPYGSIQVPGGTQPIVVHRDAISGGGYFMLGVVISADMDRAGRLRPGNTVQFAPVEMDEALAARRDRNDLVRALYAAELV